MTDRIYDDRYKTGSHVRVYLMLRYGEGGYRWAEDCLGFAVSESTTKTPIFGYASEFWDAIAMGPTIITGNITVALTSVYYIEKLISSHDKRSGATTNNSNENIVNDMKKLYWADYGEPIYDSSTSSKIMEARSNSYHSFDILYTIGEYNNDHVLEYQEGKVYKEVYLLSTQESVSQNDTPLVKNYSFIAKKAVGINMRESNVLNNRLEYVSS